MSARSGVRRRPHRVAACRRCGSPTSTREMPESAPPAISPHNEIMHLHQMFSFPVACLVFALLGLALGLNTRKEGKLAGFTLGLAVILVYCGLLGIADAWTKAGNWRARRQLPGRWARWMPNIVLGVVGIVAVWWRSRSAGGALTFARARRGSRAAQRDRRPTAGAARRRPAAPRLVRRGRDSHPGLPLPAPRLLDLYVSGRYLRVVGAGVRQPARASSYIGTFIDKSEKLFKGQADGWMFLSFLYYSTPQFIVLRRCRWPCSSPCSATIGGLTRTGELIVMRACGVSLYRAALPLLVLALVWSGGAVPARRPRARAANRRAEVLDDRSGAGTPHTLRRRQLELARRASRRAASTTTRRSTAGARTLHGLSVFETARAPVPADEPHLRGAAPVRARAPGGPSSGWAQRFAAGDQATRESFDARPARRSRRSSDFAAMRRLDTEPDDVRRTAGARQAAGARAASTSRAAAAWTSTADRVSVRRRS